MKADPTMKQALKSLNRQRIYQLLRQQGALAKQDIAYQLRLSLPTVTQDLTDLRSIWTARSPIASASHPPLAPTRRILRSSATWWRRRSCSRTSTAHGCWAWASACPA